MTVKKHLRAQEIALQNRLPCVYLVDSRRREPAAPGRGLPRPRPLRPHLLQPGRMSAAGHRADRLRHGLAAPPAAPTCPAMSDETIIVRGQGTIFLGGPPLVKAATGEVISAEELGGADTHGRRSGVVDHVAADDEDALSIVRSIVARLDTTKRRRAWTLGRAAPAGLRSRGALRHRAHRRARALRRARGDRPASSTAPSSTSSRRSTARPWSPASRASGAIRWRSWPTTACCSRESALKGAHFIELACQRKIPLIFLQNISGFMVGGKYEAGGIAKDGAKLVTAVASRRGAQVHRPDRRLASAPATTACAAAPTRPASCGAGPTAASASWAASRRPACSPPSTATPTSGRRSRRRPSRRRSARRYEDEGNPYFATARLWDDGVIDPAQTRDVLGLSISRGAQRAHPGDTLRRVQDVAHV